MTAFLGRFVSLALLSLVAGCGGGSGGAVVTGKVTSAGAAVTGGTLVFEPLSGNGRAVTAAIKKDGTYEAKGVIAGDYKVTVDTEYLKATAINTPKLPAGIQVPPSAGQLGGLTYVKIDPKYSKSATTDLKTTVSGSKFTYDVTLK